MAALNKAFTDDAVRAIVITGTDTVFSAGAEIKEFDLPARIASPTLHELIQAIESSPKPCVAAIRGLALGGGLELALGCHYRLADRSTSVGLPEIRLGWMPGVGGTLRLPRLIGVERALAMVLDGARRSTDDFQDGTLFDAVVSGDLMQAALRFAIQVATLGPPYKVTREIPLDTSEAARHFANARHQASTRSPGFHAPRTCIDAMEVAATESFERFLRFERQALQALGQRPEAKALQYYFFGQRTATKIPGLQPRSRSPRIGSVSLVGKGPVLAYLQERISTTGSTASLYEEECPPDESADADLIVCTLEASERVLRSRSGLKARRGLMAFLVSPFELDLLLETEAGRQGAFGLHILPSATSPSCEVARPLDATPGSLAAIAQFLRACGLVTVIARASRGLIAARMRARRDEMVGAIVGAGLSLEQMEGIHRQLFDSPIDHRTLPPGSTAPSPKAPCPEDAVDLMLYTLANEGAKLLEEDVAWRAVDVDVICVAAIGFRAYLGGPLYATAARGVDQVVDTASRWAEALRLAPSSWPPSNRLGALARQETFL